MVSSFCASITCSLEQGQKSLSILQVLARYGNCVRDRICPSGLSPLSLQRSPIMLLALTSPVTPCHTLPARFLPFLLASSSLLPARPHQYSRQELSWVWLPLLLSWAVGRMWDKPHSCQTRGLLLRHSQGQLGCETSFTQGSSSWKVAVLLGLVLNLPNSAREFIGRTFPSEMLSTPDLCPEFPPRFP